MAAGGGESQIDEVDDEVEDDGCDDLDPPDPELVEGVRLSGMPAESVESCRFSGIMFVLLLRSRGEPRGAWFLNLW